MAKFVNILKEVAPYQPGEASPYGIFDPIYENLHVLDDMGVTINFVSATEPCVPQLSACDILLIDSRAFISRFGNPENRDSLALEVLNSLSQNADIFWFDTRDSAGTTQFAVLPYVKKYLKKQLYHDRNVYTSITSLYASRLFTDFYHKYAHIYDDDEISSQDPISNVDLRPDDLAKLGVAWNIGLERGRFFLNSRMLWNWSLSNNVSGDDRRNLLFAVMRTHSGRRTVAYQRDRSLRALRDMNIEGILTAVSKEYAHLPMPLHEYLRELRNSTGCLSPFGWGEICHRDFESIVCGAVLLKPNLSCIQTWPEFFRPMETYIPFSWDLKDLPAAVERLFDTRAVKDMRDTAWSLYSKYMGSNGSERFCDRFYTILNNFS